MGSAARIERSEPLEDQEIRDGEDGPKVVPRPISRSVELELAHLQGILDREEETLALLLETSENEREALAYQELQPLAQVIERQARWVSRLADLEGQRTKCTSTLAKGLALAADDLSLGGLSDHVGTPWRESLLAQRERILRRVEDLTNIGWANRALLEASTGLAEDGITFLASLQRIEDGYGRQGRPSSSFRTGVSILDTRA